MALQFNPPDWLIQEYMQRKSEPQQALETLVGAATTYGQFKQTQDQNKIANEFKAADSKRQDETLNIARQKDARESAAIGYDPTNPTEYLDMVREKMRSENKLKQAQAGEADAKADWYRNRPAPVAGGGGGAVKPPTGYRWTETGDLEPIAGGPAALKIADKETKEAGLRNAAIQQADTVMAKVDQALGLVGPTTAGAGGAVFGVIPGTGAVDLEKTVDTIKANLGFATLQEMRRNSPTGGALGQIAVQELNMLQSTVASLDRRQSPEQLRRALGEVKGHYARWKEAAMGQVAPATGGGSTGPHGQSVTQNGVTYTWNPATGQYE